ncbi:MAG: cation:proton antiporter domain-containing protein [Planctomycetota bacterium]|jgi:Kef-type K+ transport system membrane component KefB
MHEYIGDILGSSGSLNFILIIGIAIFTGTVGARIFQRLRIPQILGYLAIGIILGPVLNVISSDTLDNFQLFNLFALGIIGFLIGGELKRDIFVKFGRQVIAILLFEGLTAFLLVGGMVFLLMLQFYNWQIALSVGVLLGAICAATDPASTVNVLWEYKTRGPITTMLTAVVALDDALALLLYITSVGLAGVLTGQQGNGEFLGIVLESFKEIFGSLILGIVLSLVLRWIVKKIDDNEKILVFTIACILLSIGLAEYLHFDVILTSMALGVALINLLPRRSLKSFELMRKISPPVYVLFFVIIGARFNISGLNLKVLLLFAAYVIGSIVGKTSGSYCGAAYSKAVPTVKKYLGFCLYQQGTIAIALLIMASSRFEGEIREVLLSVIVLGVFTLQFLGPICVKLAVRKAGEEGMNITEEDLIKTRTIGDVMDTKVPAISAGMSLSEVIKIVSNTDSFYYSVLDVDEKLIGSITLDGIRNTFITQELNDWLVALDIMEPVVGKVASNVALADGFEKINKLDVEYLPVVDSQQTDKLLGVLNARAVRRKLSAEVLARQKEADSMQGLSFG